MRPSELNKQSLDHYLTTPPEDGVDPVMEAEEFVAAIEREPGTQLDQALWHIEQLMDYIEENI